MGGVEKVKQCGESIVERENSAKRVRCCCRLGLEAMHSLGITTWHWERNAVLASLLVVRDL